LTGKEAIRRGILDSDLSTYKDLRTGRCYTIQEAIDEGMLVATLDDNKTPKDSTGECIYRFMYIY